MTDFKPGDRVICVNNRYLVDGGVAPIEVGAVYTVRHVTTALGNPLFKGGPTMDAAILLHEVVNPRERRGAFWAERFKKAPPNARKRKTAKSARKPLPGSLTSLLQGRKVEDLRTEAVGGGEPK